MDGLHGIRISQYVMPYSCTISVRSQNGGESSRMDSGGEEEPKLSGRINLFLSTQIF